jgi:Ca2+-binding RTX toxin-like protein
LKETATFNIIVDGVVDDDALQAAKDFVLNADDIPTQVASENTNYEAGFNAALNWFSNDDNTLDDPDVNQTIFISDGVPNRVYPGNGSVGSKSPGSNQAAVDHVLGQAPTDDESEFDGLLGSFEGVNGTVDAIGINVGDTAKGLLDQVDDDGDADNITTGEGLAEVLDDLTQGTNLAAVGDDSIIGGGGDDLIFGDAIFTDDLASAEALALAPGSSWSVISSLAGSGFFDNDPGKTEEEEIMDFLRDPANQATYDFGRESLADGVGREGGNDTIDGGAGNDLIFGQEGDDIIDGGTGDDTIIGGSGNDTMTGGSGSDVFLWGSADFASGETDTLTDFESGIGNDVLDFTALLSGVNPGDDGDELDAFFEIVFGGGNTTIGVDANGDGNGFTDATVVVENVDLTGGSGVQADIINDLIDQGNLVVA